MTTTGTKEWASTNFNLFQGCSHGCRYCYAMKMALRFKRIENEAEWETMVFNTAVLNHRFRKREGRIMFPSSHDITPDTLKTCLIGIDRLTRPGNQVLITTKPHYDCVKAICQHLRTVKNLIQFRFTITSMNQNDARLRKYMKLLVRVK